MSVTITIRAKPFCDGTHSKIGFQGAIAAVEQSAK